MRRLLPAARPVLLLVALAGSLAACLGAGGPPPSAETSMANEFQLTSNAFPPGGAIPARFTCDGEDASPDLSWTGAPDRTAAFVLLVDDPDAGGFVHWLAYDLTGSESGALPQGVSASPDAPPQGTNDFGRIGWGGPCPPSGEHRYRFTLHALAAPLGLEGAPQAAELREALERADILATAALEGRYRRR